MIFESVVLGFIGLLINEKEFKKSFLRVFRSNKNKKILQKEEVHEIQEKSDERLTPKVIDDTVNFLDQEENSTLDGIKHDIILRVKGLSKTYPAKKDKKALDNFSIDIKSGQVFGLLGPNGAGKTTFLKILSGVERCDSGRVFIKGNDILEGGNGHCSEYKLGFCPQFDILWPSLTVKEHLKFFSLFRNVDKTGMTKNIDNLIQEVD